MSDEERREEQEVFQNIGMSVAGELMMQRPPTGEHMWTVPVWYRVDPSTMEKSDDGFENLFMDMTRATMVVTGELGCVLCRRSYTYGKYLPCEGSYEARTDL